MSFVGPIFCIIALLFLSWVAVDTYNRNVKYTTALNSYAYLHNFLETQGLVIEVINKLHSAKFGVRTLADFMELTREDLVDAGAPRVFISRYAQNRAAIFDYIDHH